MDLETADYPTRVPDRPGGEGPVEDALVRNWARNATLAPADAVATPRTEAELAALLAGSTGGVRVLGSRMSPGRMLELQDAGDVLLDLQHLAGVLEITDDSITCGGATPLQDIYTALSARGRMLPASPGVIASQTVAGALATGTHGQGLQQSSIADAVLSIRLVLADGSTLDVDRDHPYFPAAQLSLGLLGVITRVRLMTVPSPVYSCLKTAVSADTLDTDLETWNRDYPLTKAWWFPDENQVHVWLAREADPTQTENYRARGSELVEGDTSSDAMNATVDQTLAHLRSDTRILDENGKPFRTVTRFKDFTDVTGDIYQVFCRGIATPQINVEIAIPLTLAGGLVKRIKDWHAETRPHLHYPIILRCTGASESWLSPAYGQETCFFGFVVYYAEDGSLSPEGVSFLHEVEKVLAAEGGRPHWGKYFEESLYDWPALYPRWEEFAAVRDTLDPGHRFANAFTGRLFGDPA